MKNYFTILLALWMSAAVSAKPEQTKQEMKQQRVSKLFNRNQIKRFDRQSNLNRYHPDFKSSEVLVQKYRLDSIIAHWGNQYYEYDYWGRLTLDRLEYNDDEFGYIEQNKFLYNPIGLLDSYVEQFNDSLPEYVDVYIYDDNKRNIAIRSYTVDEDSMLSNIDSIYYDNVGNIIQITSYYPYNEMEMDPVQKQVFSYNDNATLKYKMVSYFDDFQWINSEKETYEYNEAGQEIKFVSYNWNQGSNDWFISDSIIQEFDEMGRVILFEDNSPMGFNYKEETMYYADKEEVYSYLLEEGNWVIWDKIVVYLDEDGVYSSVEVYDIVEDTFLLTQKGTLDYDKAVSVSELWLPYDPTGEGTYGSYFYDDEEFKFNKAQYYAYYPNVNIWEDAGFEEHYFSLNNIELSTDYATLEPEFSVYPNPASTQISIAGIDQSKKVSVKIYSVTGQLISAYQISTLIDVSYLNKGIYLYTVEVDGRRFSGKFIKE